MTPQVGQQLFIIHLLPDISKSKGNLAINFGQLIEYNARILFLQKSYKKLDKQTKFRPLLVF